MARIKKAVVVAGVAVGIVVGTAGASSAAGFSGMSKEKYDRVRFGMSRQEVLDIVGQSACADDGKPATAESVVPTFTCWVSGIEEWAPYSHLTFNADGKLYMKSFYRMSLPSAPSMTAAQYKKVTVGMTEEQVLKTVGANSCVVTDVAQPAFPSTAGATSTLACWTGKGTGFLDAQAWFRFKDGKVFEKNQRDVVSRPSFG
ncbi:BLIP family protein [Streptomyces sp. NPDC004667]|uniref:BLIP family protein n=1 Tax=Streptomyces sp. NPDC004667 TaxID=3154285 RepID=UPI0033A4894D